MKDKAGIERPWLYRAIRVVEMIGLLTLFYGLAASAWFTAAAGALTIIASYRLYKRWFPMNAPPDGISMGMGDGGD